MKRSHGITPTNKRQGEVSMRMKLRNTAITNGWMRKISLVLIFTMLFSTFMHQGWYKPQPALATGTTDGRIVFSNNSTTPQQSGYTASTNTFAAGAATVAGAIPTFVVNKSGTTRNENIVGYVTTGGQLYVMRYNGSTWSNEWNIAVGGNGVNGRRFDIAYESASGRAMVVYSTNATGSAGLEMAYRIWNGSTWTAAANISSARLTQNVANNAVSSIKLASRKGSNEIALLACDNGTTTGNNATLTSFIWDGTAWGNEPATAHDTAITVSTTMALQYDNFDLAYESLSGELVVVWSRQAAAYNGYRTYSSGTWGAVTAMPGTARAALQTYLVSNPRTNQLLAMVQRSGTAGVYGYVWDGSAWNGQTSLSTTVNLTGTNKKFITGQWLNVGGTDYAVAIWVTSTAGTVGYNQFTGGAWGTAATNATGAAFADQWIASDVDPNTPDTLMLTVSYTNTSNYLLARRLVLTAGPTYTWTTPTGGALTTALPNVTTQCWDFRYNDLDITPPVTSGLTFDNPVYNTFVGSPFTFHGDLSDPDTGVTACEYCVKNGADCTSADTWIAGTLSGTGPWTCTATNVSTYSNAGAITSGDNVYIDVRGTSIGGTNLNGGTGIFKTMDKTAPSDITSFTVTPGNDQNSLSWASPGTDANSGFAGHTVTYLPGATAPANCSTGTTLYTGTATSYTHTGLTPSAGGYSYRVCAVDNVNIQSAGRTGTGLPHWGATVNCGRCHGDNTSFDDGAGRDNPDGAFIGSHEAHAVKLQTPCSTCHVNPTTTGHRNGLIEMQATISGGTYTRGTSFAQTNVLSTTGCSNISCHGANNPTPQWGVGTVTCVDCHAGSVQAPNASLLSGSTVTQRDNVFSEFGLAWGHKKSGRGTVTPSDCIVCHLEGNYATQKTSSLHADGKIDLRDPDGAGETEIKNISGATYSFVTFTTSYAAGSRTSTGQNSNTVDNILTQKFCLACHDSNGATNTTARTTYGTPSQYMPFGGVNLGSGYTTTNGAAANGGLIDAKSQFATTNSSYHPVRGPVNKDFPTPARLSAPYNNFTRAGTSGTKTNGVVMNCFDCHTSGTSLTNRTIVAHGNANTLRGTIYVSGPTLCTGCHALYTSTANHDNGSALGVSSNTDGSEGFNTTCHYCHGSNTSTTRPARPFGAQDYHGNNALVGGGLWPTINARPVAFIRGWSGTAYHRGAALGGTSGYAVGSPTCGTGTCPGGGQVGNGTNQTYTPGGQY